MDIFAIITSFVAIMLFQERGHITTNTMRMLLSVVLLIVSGVLFSLDYGVLRGIFILIGLVSLLGTIVTLLLYKVVTKKA